MKTDSILTLGGFGIRCFWAAIIIVLAYLYLLMFICGFAIIGWFLGAPEDAPVYKFLWWLIWQ